MRRRILFGVLLTAALLLAGWGAYVYPGSAGWRAAAAKARHVQPPDLRRLALAIYEDTYIMRPKLNADFSVAKGEYELILRRNEAMAGDAARAYVQGAALHEYALECISRGSVFSNRDAGKMVALTFDDGPFAGKTEEILRILQENDCRATFFSLGRYVNNHPELARRVLAAGCELGSHSWFHAKQTSLSAEERAEDFARVAKAFEDAVGSAPYLFRAPYGAVDDSVKGDVAGQDMISVLWSLDTEDWRAKSADQVYNSVLNVVKDGDIILMHENGKHTLEALPRVLADLKAQGYQVVTVSELIYAGSEIEAAAEQK